MSKFKQKDSSHNQVIFDPKSKPAGGWKYTSSIHNLKSKAYGLHCTLMLRIKKSPTGCCDGLTLIIINQRKLKVDTISVVCMHGSNNLLQEFGSHLREIVGVYMYGYIVLLPNNNDN